MNYLKDTGVELEKMLSALDENEKERVIRFVQSKIYESYKNGKKAGDYPPKKPYGKYSKRGGK